MSNPCQHISLAIKICKLSGNTIKEISQGWTNAKKVFHFTYSISFELKNRIKTKIPTLEYWTEEDNHYEYTEGFFCNECKEGISFPLKG